MWFVYRWNRYYWEVWLKRKNRNNSDFGHAQGERVSDKTSMCYFIALSLRNNKVGGSISTFCFPFFHKEKKKCGVIDFFFNKLIVLEKL